MMFIKKQSSLLLLLSAVTMTVSFLLSFSCYSVTLDLETHNALVDQLESVLAQLDKKDPSYVPSQLRLSDLLSDRARIVEFDANEKKVQVPKGVKLDRRKALSILESIEPFLDETQKTVVYLQRAQIEQLLGNEKKSEKLLAKITRKSAPLKVQSGSIESDSYWTAMDLLADLYFQRGLYKKAFELYKKTQASDHQSDFSEFRIAWCNYYFGNLQLSMSQFESLLNKNELDLSLRKEITRDLISIYATDVFSKEKVFRVKKYASKISESDIETHLKQYASDLKRLGKVKESAIVLLNHIQVSKEKESELDSKIELFENLVNVGKKKEAVDVLRSIIAQDCKDFCSDLEVKLYRTFKNWMEEEKTLPSSELYEALFVLTQVKSVVDKRMVPPPLYAGVKLAQDSNHDEKSIELLKWMISVEKNPEMKENLLKAYIHSSEKNRDSEKVKSHTTLLPSEDSYNRSNTALSSHLICKDAYLKYVELGRNKQLKSDVYQSLVDLLIETKNWTEAEKYAIEFYTFNQKGSHAYVHSSKIGSTIIYIYQQTAQTEKEKYWSKKLTEKFKGTNEKVNENKFFSNYARISSSEIKLKMEQKRASKNDILELISLSENTHDYKEKFYFLNDAFLVALQLNDGPSIKVISVKLSNIYKQLKQPERNLAIEKIIYRYDLEKNYLSSLEWERKMSFTYNPKEDKARKYKWVVKSRIAKKPDTKLEREIVQSSSYSSDQRIWILDKWTSEDHKGLSQIEKYMPLIKADPIMENRILLAASYSSSPKIIASFLKRNRIRSTNVLRELSFKTDMFERLSKSIQNYSQLKIKTSSLNHFSLSVGRKAEFINAFESDFIRHNKEELTSSLSKLLWVNWTEQFIDEIKEKSKSVSVHSSIRKEFDYKMNQKISSLERVLLESKQKSVHSFSTSNWITIFNQFLSNGVPFHRRVLLKNIQYWSRLTHPYFKSEWKVINNGIIALPEDRTDIQTNNQKISQININHPNHGGPL